MHTFLERIYDFYVLSWKCYNDYERLGLACYINRVALPDQPDIAFICRCFDRLVFMTIDIGKTIDFISFQEFLNSQYKKV